MKALGSEIEPFDNSRDMIAAVRLAYHEIVENHLDPEVRRDRLWPDHVQDPDDMASDTPVEEVEDFVRDVLEHRADIRRAFFAFGHLMPGLWFSTISNHDASKFDQAEICGYVLKWHSGHTGQQVEHRWNSALVHHYMVNEHHPIHFYEKGEAMPTVRVYEAVLDQIACELRHVRKRHKGHIPKDFNIVTATLIEDKFLNVFRPDELRKVVPLLAMMSNGVAGVDSDFASVLNMPVTQHASRDGRRVANSFPIDCSVVYHEGPSVQPQSLVHKHFAIVMPIGTGKTTVCTTLPGFLDIDVLVNQTTQRDALYNNHPLRGGQPDVYGVCWTEALREIAAADYSDIILCHSLADAMVMNREVLACLRLTESSFVEAMDRRTGGENDSADPASFYALARQSREALSVDATLHDVHLYTADIQVIPSLAFALACKAQRSI
jgi:hypothetical protein